MGEDSFLDSYWEGLYDQSHLGEYDDYDDYDYDYDDQLEYDEWDDPLDIP